MITVVVDGNDGAGKTTLVELLRQHGYTVTDRGIPTKRTDDSSVKPVPGEVYLILDVPVKVSRERLQKAGKDLTERYHTVKDLTYYRKRFQVVARQLPNCFLIDANVSEAELLAKALSVLQQFDKN